MSCRCGDKTSACSALMVLPNKIGTNGDKEAYGERVACREQGFSNGANKMENRRPLRDHRV